MFPTGAPGVALLLLRFSVAASVVFAAQGDPNRGTLVVVVAVAICASLCTGFLTPIAALLTIPVYIIESACLRFVAVDALVPILQALSLSLLGPGSWSVDAYRYGRRVVVLPHKYDRDAS
jgi:uncharacterized membrane protein YvlD (DUF360 family)